MKNYEKKNCNIHQKNGLRSVRVSALRVCQFLNFKDPPFVQWKGFEICNQAYRRQFSDFANALDLLEYDDRPVVPGGAGGAMAPPDMGRSVNPISTKGGRLCPPNNTPRIFRPFDGPVMYLL